MATNLTEFPEFNSTTGSSDLLPRFEIGFESLFHFTKDFLIGLVSFQCIQLLLDYIESKPPGQKSFVDTLTKTFLINLNSINILWTLQILVMDLTLDSGKVLAMIFMWPFFNEVDCMMIVSFLCTVFFQVLASYPNLIEKDFTTWLKVFGACLLTYFVAMDTVMHLHGIYPPPYYLMRRLPFQPQSAIVRGITFGIFGSGSIILRLKFCIQRNNGETNQSDSKIVSDKSFLFIIMLLVCTVFYMWLTNGQAKELILRTGASITLLAWPIAMILGNTQVREFSARKHPRIAEQVMTIEDKMTTFYQRFVVQPFTRNVVHSVTVWIHVIEQAYLINKTLVCVLECGKKLQYEIIWAYLILIGCWNQWANQSKASFWLKDKNIWTSLDKL